MNTTTDGKFRFLGMAALAVTLSAVGGYGTARAQQWPGWPAQQSTAQQNTGQPRANSWNSPAQRDWSTSEGAERAAGTRPDNGASGMDGWEAAAPNGFGTGAEGDRGAETGTEEQYGQHTWANVGKPASADGQQRQPQASYWHHDPGSGNGYGVPMAPPPAWGGGYFGFGAPYYGPYGRNGYGFGGWPFDGGGMPGFNPFGFW